MKKIITGLALLALGSSLIGCQKTLLINKDITHYDPVNGREVQEQMREEIFGPKYVRTSEDVSGGFKEGWVKEYEESLKNNNE
jgi:hypothetical protein